MNMDTEIDSPLSRYASFRSDQSPIRKFRADDFKANSFLGAGTFGVVVLATSHLSTNERQYALKSLSKSSIVDKKQLHHVKGERNLWTKMNSPFIVRLHGTYETMHQLVFVMEHVDNGDLWSVIYQDFYKKGGLPLELVIFYTASIIHALAHMHSKHIVYRDLKPENVLIDSNGYLCVADFGLSTTIPYTIVDSSTGSRTTHTRSFSTCGTASYIAPEVLLGLGHDSAIDIWALGVTLYELLAESTPFGCQRYTPVRQIFANIKATRSCGIQLSASFEAKVRCPNAKDLVRNLLRPDPADRIGYRDGATETILQHEFFADFDMEGLLEGSLRPVHIPSRINCGGSLSKLPAVKRFHGDQNLFEFF